jgi:acetolactate synthase-1/2/3 large subunit
MPRDATAGRLTLDVRPGATNLLTGVATVHRRLARRQWWGEPAEFLRGVRGFPEIDQLAVMKPVTKWAERIYDAQRIPEIVATALRQTMTGRPGPVYIDMPGDVLNEKIAGESYGQPPETAA